MIPSASGNQRVLLRGVAVAIDMKPREMFEKFAHHQIVQMCGAVDGDNVDVEMVANFLINSLNDDEFHIGANFIMAKYDFYIDRNDIRVIAQYCKEG